MKEDLRIFRIKEVRKSWHAELAFTLNIPHLTVRKGEKVALVGLSGCGKSTLLDLLAMVLRPDQASEFSFAPKGEAPLDVMEAWERKDLNALARARMRSMGYVLQTGGLLPFLSVSENIGLSRRGLGMPGDDTVERLAERLGIVRHLRKLPSQLSVGERQRVAIARAMAHEPSVVLADEPTASLDPINAGQIMALFSDLSEEFGVTLVLATHDWEWVAQRGFRRVQFNVSQDKGSGEVRAVAMEDPSL